MQDPQLAPEEQPVPVPYRWHELLSGACYRYVSQHQQHHGMPSYDAHQQLLSCTAARFLYHAACVCVSAAAVCPPHQLPETYLLQAGLHLLMTCCSRMHAFAPVISLQPQPHLCCCRHGHLPLLPPQHAAAPAGVARQAQGGHGHQEAGQGAAARVPGGAAQHCADTCARLG